MLRHTIRASENTSVDAEIAALRAECARNGVPDATAALVTHAVSEVLSQLVARGKQLAAMGSQMHVDRDITGSGYAVKIVFSANERRTFLQRLGALIRGR